MLRFMPPPVVDGTLAILGCAYLFMSLPTRTQLWCLAWNAFGLVVYLLYARRNSLLAQTA